MAHQPLAPRLGWRWSLILCGGLAWLSLGCSPQTLTMFLLPFTDDKKDPEYKLFTKDSEVQLVILSNFATRQFQPEIMPADRELADSVAGHLRKRCQANKHNLKLVPQADVRAYQLKQMAEEGDVSPFEIGKHFKADFVLDLTIEQFGLFKKDGYPKMYGGSTRINVQLFDTKTKDEEPPVFRKSFVCEYSGSRGIPMEVGNSNPADFRQMFIRRLGRDISRLLIAFPLDELKEWDG